MAGVTILAICLWSLVSSSFALDNGLALTPPMGWLTWERFRCITDCTRYPDECISENLIKRTSDLMVSEGYLKAGYEYVGIDDCWLEKERDKDGRMVPDRERFPSGMKALADYVHSKGLKFGLYQDYGNKTCAGYPGILGSEKLDMETFAEWGVDYLKLDGCNVLPSQMDEGYPQVGKYLNETGRPIVYSCSWPAYQIGQNPNYTSIAKHCNLWRNYDDIDDSWASLNSITNWFADQDIAQYAGPGHWNDPDMLLIGNYGLSEDQARVQMALWTVMAAPLLMSANLATMKHEFRKILLNKDIIAVDQDPLGKQGSRVYLAENKKFAIWTREITGGAYAVAFVNYHVDGAPKSFYVSYNETKLPDQTYALEDLYHEEPNRRLHAGYNLEVRINPSGVKFYKFTPEQRHRGPDGTKLNSDVKFYKFDPEQRYRYRAPYVPEIKNVTEVTKVADVTKVTEVTKVAEVTTKVAEVTNVTEIADFNVTDITNVTEITTKQV